MDKKVLLVPESGGEAGFDFVQYCASHYDDCTIIAVDCIDNVPAKFLADIFYQIPPCTDENYLSVIETIILQENVTHVIPTFEHGLKDWKDLVTRYDLTCIIDFEKVIFFKDKYKTAQRCSKYDIPTIDTELLTNPFENWVFNPNQKLYIKPRSGSGSKNNYVCAGLWEYEKLRPYLITKYGGEEMLVQPFTQGIHWSVDICVSDDEVMLVTKKALAMQGSKIITSEIVYNEKLEKHCNTIIKKGLLCGIYNIEFIESEGEYKLLEINTRLSGGMIYSVTAGAKIYDFCLGGTIFSGSRDASKSITYGIYNKITKPKSHPIISGAKVCLTDQSGKVLLTKRDDVPFWTLPGGGREPGENELETALRELEEELGYKAHILKKQCTVGQQGKKKRAYTVFQGAYDGSPLKKQPGEVADIKFFPVYNLPYPIDSVTESIIQNIRSISYYKNVHIRYE